MDPPTLPSTSSPTSPLPSPLTPFSSQPILDCTLN